MLTTARIIPALLLALATCIESASAQVTERMSVAPHETQVAAGAEVLDFNPARWITTDGRYSAFESFSPDLVSGDSNGVRDVFLHDRISGSNELVSIASDGTQGNANSGYFGISLTPDGSLVVFESSASTLVPGDLNGRGDVFLRNRLLGTTERISVSYAGGDPNNASLEPSISGDGRYVVFASQATNLLSMPTNGHSHIFVRDRLLGQNELISVSDLGIQGNGNSFRPTISDDGRLVAFESAASNLVANDTNAKFDIFVRDRVLNSTRRVSVDQFGSQLPDHSEYACISGDGRCVCFASVSDSIVTGDTNGLEDLFVYDLRSGTVERVDVSTSGAQTNLGDTRYGSISSDGTFVAFESEANNLVAGDSGHTDVFVRDRRNGTTVRASVRTDGSEANGNSAYPSISSSGRFVLFLSFASNLVTGDTNGNADIFLHDLSASGFISECNPGARGTIPCPCDNPPVVHSLGCNNVADTGGAQLTAAGPAYLSFDGLVFTAIGLPPRATCILMQGDGVSLNGSAYGHGVRCITAKIRRLYTRSSSGRTLIAPDMSAGDSVVSVRSAQLGSLIGAGESRWYQVCYRDQGLMSGCSPEGSFNATQAGEVYWSP